MKITDHDIAAAVAALATRFPDLTVDGLRPTSGIAALPLANFVEDAIKYREHVTICVAWLSVCQKRETFRRHTDTYSYKHEVEADTGRWISHTAFLVAVELAGLEMKPNPERDWAGLLKLGPSRPGVA